MTMFYISKWNKVPVIWDEGVIVCYKYSLQCEHVNYNLFNIKSSYLMIQEKEKSSSLYIFFPFSVSLSILNLLVKLLSSA